MPLAIINGTEMFYEDRGPRDAPAIVFSHSLFFDHRMFEAQLEHFAKTYRVVAYDHRSHGRSGDAADGRYDMDTMTADVVALIKHLKLDRVHVIGNSMGGFIALRLAARHPDLVRSAVIIGSSAEAEAKAKEYEPLVQLLSETGGANAVDTLMYVMFGDATLADPAKSDMRAIWHGRMAALPPAIAAPARAVVEREGVLGELKQARVPILALSGEEDHAYSAELSMRIVATAPMARCEVIAQAGHSPTLEQPEVVTERLANHFAAVDAEAAMPT
jgi:3-oxoadipate enol-lactonase